jgi:CubicO group peptidase (beta-lactamase class C family)
MHRRKLAGVVTAVSSSGGPLANLAAGRIALDSPVPFDENSICRIYSMSKPVTGIAAMMLIEEGNTRLDQQPVSDVIWEWCKLRVAVDPAGEPRVTGSDKDHDDASSADAYLGA